MAKANGQKMVDSSDLDRWHIPWTSRDDYTKIKQLANSGAPFIINLDSKKGKGGTHWTACRILTADDGKRIGFYCDPFGTALKGYPPKFLASQANWWVINPKQYQRVETQLCGYFAARFCSALKSVTLGTNEKELVRLLDAHI